MPMLRRLYSRSISDQSCDEERWNETKTYTNRKCVMSGPSAQTNTSGRGINVLKAIWKRTSDDDDDADGAREYARI